MAPGPPDDLRLHLPVVDGPVGLEPVRLMVASTRHRRLFLYATVVLALSLMLWRTEAQDAQIHGLIEAQQQRDYADCLRRVENVDRLNTLYAGLVRIERDNPFRFTSPKTVQDRIRLFTDAQLTVPRCGEKP